jgi:hypothetical protein
MPSGEGEDRYRQSRTLNFCRTLARVLKRCGDDLMRERMMTHVAKLHGISAPIPRSEGDTNAADFGLVKQIQIARFDVKRWKLSRPVFSAKLHR